MRRRYFFYEENISLSKLLIFHTFWHLSLGFILFLKSRIELFQQLCVLWKRNDLKKKEKKMNLKGKGTKLLNSVSGWRWLNKLVNSCNQESETWCLVGGWPWLEENKIGNQKVETKIWKPNIEIYDFCSFSFRSFMTFTL